MAELIDTAKDNNIDLKIGKTACCEVFDLYMEDVSKFLERLPEDIIASEMEAFALFYIAKSLNKSTKDKQKAKGTTNHRYNHIGGYNFICKFISFLFKLCHL